MIQVEKLELINYRIFDHFKINFKSGMNAIVGKNGSGKTSIIESIYLACTKSSFRYFYNANEFIQTNKTFSNINLNLKINSRNFDIETKIILDKGISTEVNNKKSSPSQYKELFNICVFTPDDLQIIKSASSSKRNFFDIAMCQIFPNSFQILKRYNSILKNRNILIKNNNYSKDEKEVFDIQFINAAIELNKFRLKTIQLFNEYVSKYYKEISESKSEITSVLLVNGVECNNIEQIIDNYQKQYEKYFDLEKYRGYSLFGPHRDEILFMIDEKDARVKASQGEQRTIALSLKFSNLEIIEKVQKIIPLLLLDDVISELDGNRREKLIEIALKGQSIITTTELLKNTNTIVNLEEK